MDRYIASAHDPDAPWRDYDYVSASDSSCPGLVKAYRHDRDRTIALLRGIASHVLVGAKTRAARHRDLDLAKALWHEEIDRVFAASHRLADQYTTPRFHLRLVVHASEPSPPARPT